MSPADELASLVARLQATPAPDDDLILSVGCGPLETLVRNHGNDLWPEIEHLARTDVQFRRALSHVWAYESPEFGRRERLLGELGELLPVTVRFVANPQGFTDPPTLEWRALEVDPSIPPGQLPRILRDIADRIERDEAQA